MRSRIKEWGTYQVFRIGFEASSMRECTWVLKENALGKDRDGGKRETQCLSSADKRTGRVATWRGTGRDTETVTKARGELPLLVDCEYVIVQWPSN